MDYGLVETVSQILAVVKKGRFTARHKIANQVTSEFYSDYPGQEPNISIVDVVSLLINSEMLVTDLTNTWYELPELQPMGFHINEFGQRDDRKIVFSNVIVGGEGNGPATSIHQFYSVAEAKDLAHQLLIAIAQAEGGSTDDSVI